ncbi:MAG TPA: Tm-1-like ATP-binding domain-containing protein [Thermodesulfobacteriota bacterium]|nr:Tm-1-like ATP-binding domain-containing protein [Thermodesulfobacteriota bacterium]
MTRKGTIAILATLDTKGKEVDYMKNLLEAQGHSAIIIDVGPLGPPGVPPDISNEETARRAGWELSNLIQTEERGRIMEEMGKGATKALLLLFQDGKIDGVIGLGGNQGSAIASMAMRALPFGFPKYLISTVASGNIRPYIGHKDIGVIFSVGDFLGGPNPVTRSILANAVSAVVGMIERGSRVTIESGERIIAVTALGNTEPAARQVLKQLHEKGFRVIPFHASGAGGSAMEELVEGGVVHGVIDLTPHELTEEIIGAGAYIPVRQGRLRAAGAKGIPQVVSTGGMEYLCFGPKESIPPKLRKRKIYMHNPLNANVKLSRNEMAQVGKAMAERLNETRGRTAVLIPLRGWSIYGAKGGPLHDEVGNSIFLKSLRNHLGAHIRLEEVDAHINDSLFADRCVKQLIEFMDEEKTLRNLNDGG